MTKRTTALYLTFIGLLFTLVVGWYIASFINREPDSVSFDGFRAYADGDIFSGDVGLIVGTYDEPGVDILFDDFVADTP